MKWQLVKDGLPTGNVFDDGLPGSPGTADFTQDAVKAYVDEDEDADGFNYTGPSDIPVLELGNATEN